MSAADKKSPDLELSKSNFIFRNKNTEASLKALSKAKKTTKFQKQRLKFLNL